MNQVCGCGTLLACGIVAGIAQEYLGLPFDWGMGIMIAIVLLAMIGNAVQSWKRDAVTNAEYDSLKQTPKNDISEKK